MKEVSSLLPILWNIDEPMFSIDEERFASLFTADGIYEFAGKQSNGHSGIKQLRHDLFNDIPHRDHPVIKLYVHGEDCMELMALGHVGYKHHTGHTNEKVWAGSYVLVKDGSGKIKMKSAVIIIVRKTLNTGLLATNASVGSH
jgi:hypothetical protein